MRNAIRRGNGYVGRCTIKRSGHRGERFMLFAELALGRLQVLLAQVPDLMPERRLLRDEQRNRGQQTGGAREIHSLTLRELRPSAGSTRRSDRPSARRACRKA